MLQRDTRASEKRHEYDASPGRSLASRPTSLSKVAGELAYSSALELIAHDDLGRDKSGYDEHLPASFSPPGIAKEKEPDIGSNDNMLDHSSSCA